MTNLTQLQSQARERFDQMIDRSTAYPGYPRYNETCDFLDSEIRIAVEAVVEEAKKIVSTELQTYLSTLTQPEEEKK